MSSPGSYFKHHPLTRFLSSLKLAVLVITSFIVAMAAGTIAESLHGREFAKRLVYDSVVFWVVLVFLFLNVLFAALVRLPWKKKLAGFYFIHLGILVTLVGGALTYFKGIDGSLELQPGEPNNRVVIDEPVLYASVWDPAQGRTRQRVVPLPLRTRPSQRTEPIISEWPYDVYLDRYLPYATFEEDWVPLASDRASAADAPPTIAYWLSLGNDRFHQDVELGTVAGFETEIGLGPLSASLLPTVDAACLERALSDPKNTRLFLFEGACIPLQALAAGVSRHGDFEFGVEQSGESERVRVAGVTDSVDLVFYPRITDRPVTTDRQIDARVDARLMALDTVRASPHFFVAKDRALVYGKGDAWTVSTLELFREERLPWMGLVLTPTRIVENKVPSYTWTERLPTGSDADTSDAALIRIVNRANPADHRSTWTHPASEASLRLAGSDFTFFIGRRVHRLDFSILLERFKMDTDPGTDAPASYESFVKVIRPAGKNAAAHVYMNHPFKEGLYTFYQSSYFELPGAAAGGFGSVFSVNYDPGRALKYLGSAFLVGGAIWHYYLRRKIKWI